MIIFKQSENITSFLKYSKNKGKLVGFVPTMGALHNGHISLIENCRQRCDLTVASIFVNPTQFNNKQDLQKYPRTVDTDIEKLYDSKTHVLFLPDEEDIYPKDSVIENYDLGHLENVLEGKYRPGHFQGVSAVLHRFLNIIQPDFLFLGQKDFQQVMVIQRLIDLKNFKTKIITVSTLREESGLAMSSRNMRLSKEQREKAVVINRVLKEIKGNLRKVPVKELKANAIAQLEEAGFKVDYVSISTKDLNEVNEWNGKSELVALIAATVGEIRLIDNMLLNPA